MASSRFFRRSASTLALMVGTALLATCANDSLAPRIARPVGFSVAPVFPAGMRAGGLVLDSVALIVVRPEAETLSVSGRRFPATSQQVILSAIIPLRDSSEAVSVTLQLFAGPVLLFSGTQTGNVHAGTLGGDSLSVPVTFVGPGANVASIAIAPRDTAITAGDSLTFGVTAMNGQQQPVAQFYTSWSSSAAGVPIDAAGHLVSASTRATVVITAVTPTGIRDSTTLHIILPPAVLAIASGNNQSDIAGNRLALPLAVRVLAADSQAVPGVRVTFAAGTGGGSVDSATATTDGGGVARSGVQLGGTTGAQTFTASMAGGRSVTFTATALPAGPISRIWTGLLGLNWSDPGNWSPLGIPTLLDNLTIGTAINLPVLSANAVAGSITLDGLGVNLTLNGHTLVTNTLTVVNGATVTLDKTLDSLLVGGTLDIDAGDELGKLTAGVLTIGGNFTQRGTASGNSFAASGLRTILNGTGNQTITFLNPGAGLSRFSDLLINKSGGTVTMATNMVVSDSLGLLSPTALLGGGGLTVLRKLRAVSGATLGVQALTVAGDSLLMGRASDFGVAATTLVSPVAQLIPALPYQDLTLAGAAAHTLVARTAVTGALSLTSATATLIPGGHTLTAGSFLLSNGALLRMTQPTDSLLVAGNFDTDARSETGNLTSGVLAVGGNLTQRGNTSPASLALEGVRTILNGAGTQTVTLFNSAPGQSFFHDLIVQKSGGSVTTPSAVLITDSMALRSATPFTGAGALTVGRTLNAVSGAVLSVAGLTMTADSLRMTTPANYGVTTTTFNGPGAQIIPALPYNNLLLNGGSTHTLSGRTTASGLVTVDGAGATLVTAGRTLVANALTISNGGLLRMNQPADSVRVAGAFDTDGRNSTADLNNGVLSVGGNFTQRGNSSAASFAPGGTRTILTGAGTQTLTLFNPSAGGSFFHDLIVNKSGGTVQAPTTVPVHDSMVVASPTTIGGAGTLQVTRKLRTANGAGLGTSGLTMTADSLLVASPANFAVGTTTFDGAGPQLVPALPYQDLALTGGSTHTLTGATTVSGALSVAAASAHLVLGGHTASAGSFLLSNGGLLSMTQSADSLLVAGPFDIDAQDESGNLTAGVLQVGGNFTQRGNASASSFAATGTRTVLNGAGNQTVTFFNPGLTQSRFRDLEVRKSGGTAVLASALVVDSSFTVQSGVDTVQGGSITAGALNVTGLVLNNTPLTLNSLHAVAPVLNNTTFMGFDPTATQLTINQIGLSLPISLTGLTFLSTPTSGFYISANELGLVPLLVTVQSNLTPSAAALLTRLLNGALVTWL